LYYLSPDDKDNISYNTNNGLYDNIDNRLSPLHEDNENASTTSRYTKSPNSQISPSQRSPSQRSPIHINESDLDLSLLSNEDIYNKEESYTVGKHVDDTTNEIIELQKVIEGSTASLEKAYLDIKILESKLQIEEATTKKLKEQIKGIQLEYDTKQIELEKVTEERIRSQSADNVEKEKSIASDYEEKLLDYAKKLAVEVINSKKLRDQILALEYDQKNIISDYEQKLLEMFNNNSKTIATYKERIASYEDNLEKMSKSIVVSAQIERKEIDHMLSEYDTEIDGMRAEHANNTKKLTAIYEAQLTMVKDENTILRNEVAACELQLLVARSQIKDLENDGNRFKSKCEALQKEVLRLEGNIATTNADSKSEVLILKVTIMII
jgi:chromosome segregation ATPase